MNSFLFFVLTPPNHNDASLAIAASRAGEVGVYNAEFHRDAQSVECALDQLAKYARNPYGVRLGNVEQQILDTVLKRVDGGLRWAVLDAGDAQRCREWVKAFQQRGGRVLIEVHRWCKEYLDQSPAIDGWIVKGHEAGGEVGEETSFILLQKVLGSQDKPVYARGGIGMHTAAACLAAGAAGVMLDNQLLLMRESAVKDSLAPILKGLVGNETVLVGDPVTGGYFRLLARPGFNRVKQLRARAPQLSIEELREEVTSAYGWDDPQNQVMPLGQDVCFAHPWATRYGNVANALRALREGLASHLKQADRNGVLAADSPLAKSHGTRYPIVQGPMTRVSDTAAFAEAVAKEGGLPMLALALMRGDTVRDLLAETTERLAGKPWGVGVLGFAPAELLSEQISVSKKFRPAFALIAGGRPDQALALEKSGVPSYLHVPSPRLLTLFLEQGARRFVFEGRECGGHVGPLTSFVLWESMVETLLKEVCEEAVARKIHVLFAGGIRDTRSAAMLATLVAPLTDKGIKVGILMGSAYLFTHEIVSTGSIVPRFQKEALACKTTVGLETGTGHASRCAKTPFTQEFLDRKKQMQAEGKNADEIRQALEELNLGRLRMASKGKARSDGRIQAVSVPRQRRDGMYMLGQVAAIVTELISVADLHRSVSDDVCNYLKEREIAATRGAQEQRRRAAQKPADVAIIGIGCLVPKAGNTREYWENILNNVDCITEILPSRWDSRLYFDPDRTAEDKIYSKWGGFLHDVVFDPLRYGIPPKALKAIDPLQLMTLEVVRQTLEDAGYAEREFDRERTSIILGASGGAGDVGAQYAVRAETVRFAGELASDLADRLPKWTEDSFAGILLNVAAGRAANRFDFGGVNFTVDAACASSLTAIYHGVVELEDGRSDLVIAGGVDTVQGPFGYLCFSKAQALSPRGRCSTFDTSADGIVISEGIAMVVLKRLADAERDGDRIYAVIKGIGGSSDGRAKSMTAPHPDGQLRALQRAYDHAGYSPATVGLFEAHGTGTVAGDSAELETVTRLLADADAQPKQSAIGSVKSLIGHTKATAGVAGLIKSTLALYHKVLPPLANVSTPNSKVADPESPLYLLKEPQPWVAHQEHARRAGVSSFGFGGTNFHVTLEEYQGDYLSSRRPAVIDRWPTELLVWRAADRASLKTLLKGVVNSLAQGAKPYLRDLAYTLAQAVSPEGQAAAVVVGEAEDLGQRLDALIGYLENDSQPLPPGTYHSAAPLAQDGALAVLFGGQGTQYPNMLRELALMFPDIRQVLEMADNTLAAQIEKSVGQGARLSRLIYTPGLYSPEDEATARKLLTRTDIAQPALGAVEAGLWHLVQRFGIRPDMAAGHSYGEYVALYAAGVLNLEDLLQVSEARGRFIVEAASGKDLGTMAALEASRAEAEQIAEAYPDLLVANHNAPKQSILSGSRESIQAVVEKVTAKGLRAQLLEVGAAFHSPFVAPARDRLAEFIDKLKLRPPAFDVYSNTTGEPHSKDLRKLRELLAQHLVKPVEFVAEIEAMYNAGARLFVGLGPKAAQTSLVDQILADRPHRVVRVDDGEGGLKGLLHALGALFAEGVALDLMPLFVKRDCLEIDLNDLSSNGREPSIPSHAWLLNGSGARPVREPPTQPLTLEEVDQRKRTRDVPAAAFPVPRQMIREEVPMSEKPVPPRRGDSWSPPEGDAGHGLDGDRQRVLAAYQETMRQFLEVQESIMLGYLTGSAPERAGKPGEGLSRARQLTDSRVVSFPKMMAESEIQPSTAGAPTPIEAVPNPLQAGSTGGNAPPGGASATSGEASTVPVDRAPIQQPPQPVPAVEPSSPSLDPDGITKLLLDIVEERTGYPGDMLGLEQNMEADLGIDSIKRVEIVGALLKALPEELVKSLDGAAEKLNGHKTMKGMIEWIDSHSTRAGAVASPFEQTGARDVDTSSAPLPRFLMQAQLESVQGIPLDPLKKGVYFISADAMGVARELASRLQAEGAMPVIIDEQELLDDEQLVALVDRVRQQHGRVRGLIHLLPVSSCALDNDATLSAWRAQTARNDKSLYRLLRLLADDLQAGGLVAAGSGFGGYFARQEAPAGMTAQGGGAVGLLKSLNDEWPDARVNTIDLDPGIPAEQNAQHVLTELRLPGGRIEVGYPAGKRTVFVTQPAEFDGILDSEKEPNADWTVLATGGARGITAEVLMDLAAKGVRLVLVGRTPEPPAETPEIARLKTEEELRHFFIERAQREKRPLKPVDIERQVADILRDREVAANLKDFREAGAEVDYRIADVRDEKQMATLFEDIYERYGRLDGVVHGAGIIEDKLLVDKSPESWSRVFDTKVDSAFLLAKFLRPEQLRFVVFFASVAGRYGNTGQTDYAAANEVMNRVAWQLHKRWQGKVKVAAINWGPWLGTRYGKGMLSPETRRKFESKGVTLVNPEAGRRFFLQEITQSPLDQVEVVAGVGPWEAHETKIGAFHTTEAPPVNNKRVSGLYPLIAGATRANSRDGEIILGRSIDVRQERYVAEHLLDEVPVLPAAVALELMVEAAASVWPDWVVNGISELRVLRGMRLEQPALDIEIVVRGSSHGDATGFDVQLQLRPACSDEPPFYRATAHLSSEPLRVVPYQSNLRAGPVPLTAQTAYRELLFHGPCLQTITKLTSLDNTGALAEVRASDPTDWLPNVGFERSWLFDPGMVDSAPQMALIWAHAMRAESALPTRFGKVRRWGTEPVGNCRMHFLLCPAQSVHQVKADVAFVDHDGNLRFFIEELECTSSSALNRLGGGWEGEISV
jgi:acyl transferase domain-containing protein/NAD(P)H-dependent flavin oxidoreductase YrpB (nitropropane dioxygenase family)/NAD(P)-dependent dehydrogenase (short-subunit alcohol dehydrogenase family)